MIVHSDIDRMIDENAKYLVIDMVDGVEKQMVDGLQSHVDQAHVHVDEQAVYIPPRRE